MTEDRRHVAELLNLYDWIQTQAALGRPLKDELTDWRVVDDWPGAVPVTTEEFDVFERWFGDILDELLGPV